jgi:hypothetical protein
MDAERRAARLGCGKATAALFSSKERLLFFF